MPGSLEDVSKITNPNPEWPGEPFRRVTVVASVTDGRTLVGQGCKALRRDLEGWSPDQEMARGHSAYKRVKQTKKAGLLRSSMR